MIIVRERVVTPSNKIQWSRLLRSALLRRGKDLHAHGSHIRQALVCAACREGGAARSVDDTADIGFCNDCIDSCRHASSRRLGRENRELGGES
jgi:hypothetical protein